MKRKDKSKKKIGDKINLIWAISKIGTRERKNSIPIKVLLPVIESIKKILIETTHKELTEKCILALGEMGDSRFGNEISIETSKELIRFLDEVFQMKGKYFQKIIEITKKMILGNILTKEEENLLMLRRDDD